MRRLTDDINDAQRADELQATCERLQRQLAKAKAKTGDLVEAVERAARDAAVIVGKPAAVKLLKTHKAGDGDPEWAVLHSCDWQLGKRCGVPGDDDYYDTDVTIERVRYVVERVRSITALQRKDHPVVGCAVLFGGDMLEGVSIFPGNAFEVDSSAYAMVMAASSLMAESILTLLQDFEEVRVYSTSGNHGRLGRKGDMNREDNLDLIAYALARAHLANQPRVKWDENLHWYDHIRIGNFSALLVHGDQVKGWSGIPAAGLARKATAWSSSLPVEWSDLFLGHYHQRMILTVPNGAQVRMTGALESGSQYAAEMMAAHGRPNQSLVFVHPERGRVTGEYPIWLD